MQDLVKRAQAELYTQWTFSNQKTSIIGDIKCIFPTTRRCNSPNHRGGLEIKNYIDTVRASAC